jgi:hypothetical protein
VSKAYRIAVAAPADAVFRAIETYDLRDSATARFLMTLRGYGRRVRRPAVPVGLVASLAGSGFVALGGRPGRELAFGLVGKFWTPSGGLLPVAAADFEAFRGDGYAKAAWNIAVTPVGEGTSILSTETRVLCCGDRARRRFRIYWGTIELFSGAIRMAMLRGIRRKALTERRETEAERPAGARRPR